MTKDHLEFIETYLRENVQLRNIQYVQTEDDRDLFISYDCIVTIKDQYVILDLDIELYPDIASYITLGVNGLANQLGKELLIGEVYSFDRNYNVYFGEDAVRTSQQGFNKQIEDIVEMEHILMFSEGYEC